MQKSTFTVDPIDKNHLDLVHHLSLVTNNASMSNAIIAWLAIHHYCRIYSVRTNGPTLSKWLRFDTIVKKVADMSCGPPPLVALMAESFGVVD